MNVGFTDINDDGYPDVYIANLATLVKDNKYNFPDVNTPMNFDLRAMAGMMVLESDKLYMSHIIDGRMVYTPSNDIERGETSTGWAWDAEFFDFDHDGDDDLYLVNGTNDYNAYSMVFGRPQEGENNKQLLLNHSRESNVFFRNHDGKLKNVSGQSGVDFRREIHGGSGYLSMNPKQLHFGLNSAAVVRLDITWPNGEKQRIDGVAANRSYIVRQGGEIEAQSARLNSGQRSSTARP